MSFDDVLIVIPCLDEAHNLPRLLRQFHASAPGARSVVADGGSRDASRAVALAHGAAVVDNPHRWQGAGVNRAVERYGGGCRWLVRVDAHADYPDDYVARLVARARSGEVAAVVVAMRAVGSGCMGRGIAAAQNAWLGTGGAAHRHPGGGGRVVDHGHHALIRLDRFVAVGGYAEDLATNEDVELDHRLRAAGGTIWLEGDLAIDYHPRRSLRALFAQYRGFGRGKAIVARRHRLRLKPRQLLPGATVPALVAAAAAPWLDWPFALPAATWIGGTLAGGVALGVRARSRCVAMAGPAALAMHLGWGCGYLAERLRR